jgi:hypothetical protein
MSAPTPAQLIRIEAEALLRLAARLEDGMSASFAQAVELVAVDSGAGGWSSPA